jgi:hypothetical protein
MLPGLEPIPETVVLFDLLDEALFATAVAFVLAELVDWLAFAEALELLLADSWLLFVLPLFDETPVIFSELAVVVDGCLATDAPDAVEFEVVVEADGFEFDELVFVAAV